MCDRASSYLRISRTCGLRSKCRAIPSKSLCEAKREGLVSSQKYKNSKRTAKSTPFLLRGLHVRTVVRLSSTRLEHPLKCGKERRLRIFANVAKNPYESPIKRSFFTERASLYFGDQSQMWAVQSANRSLSRSGCLEIEKANHAAKLL
jgi:hypothetical protein